MPKYDDFDLDLQKVEGTNRLAYTTIIGSDGCRNTMRIPCHTGDAFQCKPDFTIEYNCRG